jgi:nickel/cobalt transporter (NicO) family protein
MPTLTGMVWHRRVVQALLVGVLAVSGLVFAAPAGWAHPLGNFTVNTHLGLRIEPAAVALDVVLDVAEIPTLRAFPELGATGGGASEAEQRAYRDRTCPALVDAVRLELDGSPLGLAVVGSSLTFPPGEAGLATSRLECRLRTPGELNTVDRQLVLTDTLAVEPVGWREVTAVGDGVELAASNVPERSPSDVLRAYPPERLDEPVDQRGATVNIVEGSGVVSGPAPGVDGAASAAVSLGGVDRLTAAYTDLVGSTRLGVGFAMLAVAMAVALGAVHAVAPGHGKALMAAYLLGRDGSLRQAALIAVSVTLTHTVGVLLLGVLVSVAVVAAPERVYPWLGLASGVLLVAIGASLWRDARRRHTTTAATGAVTARAHGSHVHAGPVHAHRAHGSHANGGHSHGGHTHGSRRHEHPVPTDVRSLLAVGFAGGLVPSPSALVVLLGGIALGRAWFGVLLVLAYGAGMALALVGAGLLLVRARSRIERWSAARALDGRRAPRVILVTGQLPVLTAGLVVVIGFVLSSQAIMRL